ncbi:alpha-methylacyl-CoA racemase isoform X1 [Schistocerca piceifrons]|uniref:alpha-methylacyl-CoA racemase isoform X1 n=2 Tax=Schistocerca piceifrons TaxID=274613 RepID=UPI001F5F8D1A|nr:alpha-methylacyl-CoA racemase isoform X1 [Schistocerca piceifrons]
MVVKLISACGARMALKGLHVVELAGLAPAPFCGMILAEFGATVVRIDKVSDGNVFDCIANGKKSVAIDITHPKGAAIFRHLCKTADVLVEPYRKGVMEKLGLGPEILLAENPSLIYARLTGYGQSGTYCEKAGHDLNYVAMSGLLPFLGRKNEKPTPPLNLLADFGGGGLMCALGIVMALLERSKSGKGQVIDASMVEGAAYLGSWIFRSQHLPFWGNSRGENLLDTGVHFYEVYETKDGKYMAVGAIESKFYDELIKGLGLSSEECPHIGDFNEAKLIFQEKFLQKTQKEWVKIFDSLDACVTPVLSLEDVVTHPHNASRKAFISPADSQVPVPSPAPRLLRTPAISLASQPQPKHGQHTVEILQSLNYSSDEIMSLHKNGIVKCDMGRSRI